MAPFLIYVAVFLGVPLYVVIHGALTSGGHVTLANFSAIFTQSQYLIPLRNSLILSLWTSVGPAILGLAVAAAVVCGPADGLLRRIVSSACGVFAYFAGAPLAFVWVASLGTLGVITLLLESTFGYDLSRHFDISSQAGVGICYFYFQIPLMVIFITPALEGLRPEWKEAAQNLGATRLAYLRHVAAPILAPSFIAATLILYGSAFSAFATMLALNGCTNPVLPCKINLEMSNNVLTNSIPVGLALGTEMIMIVAVVMLVYWLVSRRAGRWVR
ncbi:MAG TPA: ABC transporter permease subunit [Solirubrobacteraceae bacterium]|nr:ABC transporter permease subunit [Solirubrobacteraceae bacterium]